MNVLISEAELRERVQQLATEVNRDFAGRPLTVVGILTGSLVFLADLIRKIEVPLKIGLIQASSYRGETTTAGELTINDALLPDVTGRHVLLLDDILDTGRTLTRIAEQFQAKGIASLRTCVLLRKLGRQEVPFEPDYTGFSIPDKFVIGYGLDYDDNYRHLPFIAELTPG